MKRAVLFSVLTILLLSGTVFATSTTLLVISNTATVVGFTPPNHKFDYVLVILMENEPVRITDNATYAPYMASLASNYSLATHYTALTHPSEPNYLALFSGSVFTPWSRADSGPSGDTGCCTAGNATNLVDRLEAAGLTWKGYAEDYPGKGTGSGYSSGGCWLGDETPHEYAGRHFPFVYYNDIIDSPARCAKLVPANSVVSKSQETDDLLLKDLSSVSTASNFMWLTPNQLDDMHDSPVSFGDKYLSMVVPAILNSVVFKTQKAALFIVFDEGVDQYPTDYVYALWAGPLVKTSYVTTTQYTQYSFLATVEQNWGLHPLTQNDASAATMFEVFQ